MAAVPRRTYSCETAAETLEWMNAIADFLGPFKPLVDAHVVNFFKDRLWELVDKEWMDCLVKEPVENLLYLPSGFVQEHWPTSLQNFVLTLKSLVLPREPKSSHPILMDLNTKSLGSVLVQGMNSKKKHEVEVLAAAINKIACDVGAQIIVDVGAGQGYLAQALSFEYQLSVIAIDASLHHTNVTSARSERIKKHYAAKLRKSGLGNEHLKVPKTVTCHVLSSDMLIALSTAIAEQSEEKESNFEIRFQENPKLDVQKECTSFKYLGPRSVLAGLHSCGDLSVNMLRTFVDCDQVKAIVCLGCCYNLVSEECSGKKSIQCGYPMSNAAKIAGSALGKSARDLACQSAERWRSLTKDAALENFQLHTLRASFQLILDKYYPEVLTSSPSIGRQGKALRRQKSRRVLESQLEAVKSISVPSLATNEEYGMMIGSHTVLSAEVEVIEGSGNYTMFRDEKFPSSGKARSFFDVGCIETELTGTLQHSQKKMLFQEFCKSGLSRLGISLPQDIDLHAIWKEAQPFNEFVGPFWSLRASLGPLVETYILLDRLLFLQEQGNSVAAFLFPLFDPTQSPRNMAILAWRNDISTL